ncbi:MAG: tRNA (adenosine(37)-N6)-threonylcarbamoyltransferase complex transferase subunit TsaD [Candidatus Omnitrophica bacterium]|nr:tRNA (adenosine(37)-N6)-threonylcarbamoyltransferase complex transferase subunit TsaD [Candidatus Omnitrophota bacterium]
MRILGIETSCDETAAAVVENGVEVLSHTVASSLAEHEKYGGIIPEIASRRQLESIQAVVALALDAAGLNLSQIDAIAVTREPGLIGSLLVGISFANALSFALGKPLIRVNHIEAHLYAAFLIAKEQGRKEDMPRLPAVGLVVSGGHSSLFAVERFKKFRIIGQTRDDAAGEAFDKVARLLNLGYPGGPVIDRLAREFPQPGITFTAAKLPGSLDFSFSGVKTAVLYYKRQKERDAGFSVGSVAAAFQDCVVRSLVEKTILACGQTGFQTIIVGGGVAANSALRAALTREAQQRGIKIYFPALPFCMDNAAMIAGLAHRLYSANN